MQMRKRRKRRRATDAARHSRESQTAKSARQSEAAEHHHRDGRPRAVRPFFRGESWDNWRTALKAAYALPMTDAEVEFFHTIAGQRSPPCSRVRELWIVAGRRGGKDAVTSLVAAHAAALFNQQNLLRAGERALVMCLACDRQQAKIVHGYIGAYFRDIPLLNPLLTRETSELFELSNGVDIAVNTNSFRAVRGRAVLRARSTRPSAKTSWTAPWRRNLKKRFPPRPLEGMTPSAFWAPPEEYAELMASYRRAELRELRCAKGEVKLRLVVREVTCHC
jgi:hypothetical protein